MSTLILIENVPTVFQEITMLQNMYLAHVRPHLFIKGSPAGTVKVQLQDENGRVIATSNSLTITALKTATYAHKYYRFDINANLIDGQIYRVAVICEGGYSYVESDFVGVCLDWDNPKVSASYINNGGVNAALDFELWERVET